ncbi:MAG: phosphohistidine phosphatase SixA [Pseudomonadales bacterium]
MYIMRHGQAHMASVDSERELSSVGVEQSLAMAKVSLSDLLINRVFVSPYIRARQTLDTVMSQLDVVDIQVSDYLTPDREPQEFIDCLDDQQGDLLVVSHMPLVSRLVQYLVYGDDGYGPAFDTSAIACLEADQWLAGCARLRWLKAPGDCF